MDSLAETVLDTVRLSLKLSTGTARYYDNQLEQHVWLANAVSADGNESWTAKATDKYEAVCALAELEGFDLMDG